MKIKRFRPYEPKQMMLLPPSLDEWLPEDHLAYFISDAVDQMDLSAVYAKYGNPKGYPPYEPRMMVKVWIYAYAVGVRSSRRRVFLEYGPPGSLTYNMLTVNGTTCASRECFLTLRRPDRAGCVGGFRRPRLLKRHASAFLTCCRRTRNSWRPIGVACMAILQSGTRAHPFAREVVERGWQSRTKSIEPTRMTPKPRTPMTTSGIPARPWS